MRSKNRRHRKQIFYHQKRLALLELKMRVFIKTIIGKNLFDHCHNFRQSGQTLDLHGGLLRGPQLEKKINKALFHTYLTYFRQD